MISEWLTGKVQGTTGDHSRILQGLEDSGRSQGGEESRKNQARSQSTARMTSHGRVPCQGEDRVGTGLCVVETYAKLRRQRPRGTLEAWMEEPDLQAGQSRSRGSKDQREAGGKEELVRTRGMAVRGIPRGVLVQDGGRSTTNWGGARWGPRTDRPRGSYGCVEPKRSRMVGVNEALAEELGSLVTGGEIQP